MSLKFKFILNLFPIYLWCCVSAYTCGCVCVHAYTHAHFYDNQKKQSVGLIFFFHSYHVVLKINLLTLDSKMPVYLPSNTIGPNLNLSLNLKVGL